MLEVCPMTLKEANAFVAEHHRHHKPVTGHKFSIGCTDGEKIVGVAIVGRPVSRERVEKVWRGEWIHKRSPYDYKIFVCKKCGKQISIQGENMDFCPACGAAQTDEAVQMVLERLEAMKDGSTTD